MFISGEQRGHSPELIALSPRTLQTMHGWYLRCELLPGLGGVGGGMDPVVIGKVFKNPCQNVTHQH